VLAFELAAQLKQQLLVAGEDEDAGIHALRGEKPAEGGGSGIAGRQT
jgi:hypothetical protein